MPVLPPSALLALAIVSEVTGTVALRASDGLTKLGPSLVVLAGYLGAFYALSLVVRHLSVSVVYAIWSGCGTALVALVGVAFLGEPATALKFLSLALVIAGVVGLNLT